MFAYNKKNGLPILGTYEMIPGCAVVNDGSFVMNAEGELDYDHMGETTVFWDAQETQSDAEGRTIFLDSAGNEVTAEDIELTEEERK